MEELEKMRKELDEAKAKFESADHFRMHLLSLTSHQFRTPLATIKGYTTILREGLYGEVNEKTKETLEKIEFAVNDLLNLVDNVMDLRKVEEGRMTYEFERIDLRKLAEDAVEALHLLAMHKGLDLTFTAPSREIFVSADAQKLRHVVQNLIDNAIKYTPSGFIKTELKETDGEAVFSVQDSGMGIPANVTPLLFEEFVRDDRVKSEIKGTGLGLNIAKNIVEAHGGKIWCESPGEGKGSTFSFSLKKA